MTVLYLKQAAILLPEEILYLERCYGEIVDGGILPIIKLFYSFRIHLEDIWIL